LKRQKATSQANDYIHSPESRSEFWCQSKAGQDQWRLSTLFLRTILVCCGDWRDAWTRSILKFYM
jgi:hypothetical protein